MSQANDAQCADPTCDRRAVVRGLCRSHYARARRNSSLPPKFRKVYDAPCVFPGCDRWSDLPTSGLCRGHYNQKRDGKPLTPLLSQLTLEQRLLSKRSIDSEAGCWLWTGSLDSPGYGTFKYKGKTFKAHRAAHEVWIGPLHGDTVHHKCAVRHCFNPNHLELATHRDNSLEMHERRAYRRKIALLEQRISELEALLAA